MRIRNFVFAMMLAAPTVAFAQEPGQPQSEEISKPTVQQQLMPESTAKLLVPAAETNSVAEKDVKQPTMAARGSATGMMIAGGALFVAGLVIGGGVGTVVAVAGAAIGAYGLYLYF